MKKTSKRLKLYRGSKKNDLLRSKLALEASREGVWDWNLVTGENWVSENWANMFGYTLDEVKYTYDFFTQHLHPDDIKRINRVQERYLSGQISQYHTVFRIVAKDGQEKWILSRGRIVQWDEAGKPVRMVGTHQDITRQKKAEMALKRQKGVLESFFTYSPDAMVHLDTHQKIIQINQQFTKLFGYTRMECYHQGLDDLIVDEALRQEGEAISRKARNNKFIQVETERIRKDGTRVPVVIRGGPVVVDGKTVGYQAIYTDITQRKREEEQVRLAKEKAEVANQIKSRFLSNMSHEIRTPMNGIHGAAMLLENTSLSQDQRELLQILKDSSNRMAETVNNLLDVSRIESGKMELREEVFELKQVVEEVMDPFFTICNSPGLTCRIDADDEVEAKVVGDRSKLSRVLYHLTSNAFKFTASGEINVSISMVRYDEPIAVYRFQVKDTGIGIHQDDLPKLFQRFYQLDDTYSKSYQGTGLGLAIVQKLVALMGGTVNAESVYGQGSSFSFEIPLKVQEFSRFMVNEKSQELMKNLDKNLRILAVEDDEISQVLLLKIGKKLGAQIDVAHNGLEAIRKFGEAPYDIVLMDVQLPNINGLEVTSVIRSFEKKFGERTPIIGVSAHAMSQDRERCLEAGMNDYLSKPVDFDKLYQVIQEWVR